MKTCVGKLGYHSVSIRIEGRTRRMLVHRAVALAWLPTPSPTKTCVAHLDGDRGNNNVENLQWVSYQENESHKAQHGTRRTGSRMFFAKLTDEQAVAVRRRYAKGGTSIPKLAAEYKVSWPTIHDVVRGRSYRDAEANLALKERP